MISTKIKERRQIIEEYHNEVKRRGIKPTAYAIKVKYYWPNIYEDIKFHMKNCKQCIPIKKIEVDKFSWKQQNQNK